MLPDHVDIVSLTIDNFDTVVNSEDSGIWFVRFFAPWCNHCKKMIPAWESSATNLKGLIGVADAGILRSDHFWLNATMFTITQVSFYLQMYL
ncbi:protein disulfide isomerase-related protein [Blastocystis sp. subtype 4]|uniref:protein disulfide isomerase-related protein n=1 Tax=Blastocystis sp. subtype 4 TaxID=944170 RepID=UPI000711F8F6|nr:protein disulfide isomerase-related protein [Blastocystis sp. subtype 4]KNB42259.1 protein disulfide isomerase-related protein [Blastocystis sp. subtype 4]|eukprot:XP_014525702.1 protein disulfide isomerase-related protein [Blastocystis sp. subtype 4]